MNRRKFLSISTLTAITWSTMPLNAKELTPIAEKANMAIDPWKIKSDYNSIEEVITALYGKNKLVLKSNKVKIKAPKLAENQRSIPLNIRTTLNAKRILILQVANEYVLTGIFEVPKDALVNYSLRVKQRQTGYLSILIEDVDGLLYINSFEIDVASGGGCGG